MPRHAGGRREKQCQIASGDACPNRPGPRKSGMSYAKSLNSVRALHNLLLTRHLCRHPKMVREVMQCLVDGDVELIERGMSTFG